MSGIIIPSIMNEETNFQRDCSNFAQGCTASEEQSEKGVNTRFLSLSIDFFLGPLIYSKNIYWAYKALQKTVAISGFGLSGVFNGQSRVRICPEAAPAMYGCPGLYKMFRERSATR